MTGTRVLTALVLIPIVIAIVLFTPTWAVALATALITIQALREFFSLGDAIGHRAYRPWTIFCALLIVVTQWRDMAIRSELSQVMGTFHSVAFGDSRLTSLFFSFVFGLTLLTLLTSRPIVESLPSLGMSCSALLLVAFPLSFAVRLHGIPNVGPRLLFFALAITWAADTTAYFVGRAIGKHPLAPHISPKKTWEGSIGSIIGSLIVAYAFHYWLAIPVPHLLAMATLGNIAGQMGDLLESACKRSAGVKDSGALLPGHGGVLDRIDALILAIPVIWYYLVLVNPSLER
jgi:phosphatidate cytidylyltransferase